MSGRPAALSRDGAPAGQGGPAGAAGWERDIAARSDAYYNRTGAVVTCHGDCRVTHAMFLRRSVVPASGLMLAWLAEVVTERGTVFDAEATHLGSVTELAG